MTLSLQGPGNGLYGPGLAFDVSTTLTITGSNHYATASFHLDTASGGLIAVSRGPFLSNQAATVIIGRSATLTLPGAYRYGGSAGQTIAIVVDHTDLAGNSFEPSATFGPHTWDPALQLESLVRFYASSGGGGLTPDQAQQLTDILNAVTQVYRNSP